MSKALSWPARGHISRTGYRLGAFRSPATPPAQQVDAKPRGLWYGLGSSWFDWMRREDMLASFHGRRRRSVYSVALRRAPTRGAGLRVLDSAATVLRFDAEYGRDFRIEKRGDEAAVPVRLLAVSMRDDMAVVATGARPPVHRSYRAVDWGAVAAAHGGVEFREFPSVLAELRSRGEVPTWYLSVDCSSGCVWSPALLARAPRLHGFVGRGGSIVDGKPASSRKGL